MERSTRLGMAMISLLFVAVVGCPSTGPIDDGEPSGEGIVVTEYVASADFPTAIAMASDGRLFYTEKATGRVRVVLAGGALLAEPFATVPVVSNSERGLLGIALHPDFAENGLVYLYYTRSAGGTATANPAGALDNRVVRLTAGGNVAAGAEELMISLPIGSTSNHNGGHLAFGPDGKLYITIGDLGDTANSQNPDALAGRILRLNDDGSVPDDNPFGPANPTYALGLRNSFDLAFDPAGGELWASENGTINHDEVNRILRGGNLGWPLVLGVADTAPAVAAGTYADPVVDHTSGSVVPTGLAFAPDDTFGAAVGHQLFVAQYATGRIIRYRLNAARDAVVHEAIFAQAITGGMTDLAFGPDSMLYVATSTQILRMAPGQ